MPASSQQFLDAIERGLPGIHRRLLSAEDARALVRRNLDGIREAAGSGGALAPAEQAFTDAVEELLKGRNPAADEMRDQEAEDRAFGRVEEAFRRYAEAARSA